ncbi:MAG: QueT transporter family protein, partial [Clostridia bacterium]|nr:QueT transporter family protein [Clostridia bacterium]
MTRRFSENTSIEQPSQKQNYIRVRLPYFGDLIFCSGRQAKMNSYIKRIARAGVIASLYVVLVLPVISFASGMVQFR